MQDKKGADFIGEKRFSVFDILQIQKKQPFSVRTVAMNPQSGWGSVRRAENGTPL